MKLSDYENDQSYRSIIEKLEPRYAPKTSIKFTPPKKERSLHRLILWSGRAAAVLIIACLVTLFVSQPQPTNGAVKIIESAIDNIRTSGYCNIEFSARILPSRSLYPLKMSPRGELKPVTLTFRSDSICNRINLKWTDDNSRHSLTMYSGNIVNFHDAMVSGSTLPSEVFSILSNTLLSPDPDYIKILDSQDLTMKTKGDDIIIKNGGKNNKLEFCMTFSKSSGRLLDFYAYDHSYGKKILMIKTNKINYHNNIQTK
ncbi:MAG: hypothetical protein K2K75_03100 [Muribaculaceae bacterium]|nr:hypothetical protein [Muribaculaceae bacterium]